MKTISIQELHDKFKSLPKNEMILDIRTPEEYAEGHIPGSRNIPVDTLVSFATELKSFKTIYMHCKSGGRVKNAYSVLAPMGLENIVCIIGEGFPDWEKSGYEISQG